MSTVLVPFSSYRYERTAADYIEKLPRGMNSTKGLGKTEPNPEEVEVLDDGVAVPLGKPVAQEKVKKTDLLYNEYIVYNVEQVNIRYLLRIKFDYKI
jgi:poly [ADP-ribose] polymerase